MKEVEIYTDGACSGNPGPGGYGAILLYNGKEKELSGGEPITTNNRMEMLAAIEALSALKEPCSVTLYSDSQYLINSIEKGWVYNWKKNGYKMKGGALRPNVDLWEVLLPLLATHNVSFKWVRGHNGNERNERCDRLAVAASQQAANSN